MLPMPAAVHLVPVALVLAVMTPHPSDSVSVAYDVYPIPTVNPPEVSSKGSNVPSVVMVFSYEHDTNHGSQAEQPEFGSIGTAGFSGMNKLKNLKKNMKNLKTNYGGTLQFIL